MPVNSRVYTIVQTLVIVIFVFLLAKLYGSTLRSFLRSRFAGGAIQPPHRPPVNALCEGKHTSNLAVPEKEQDDQPGEIQLYKDVYFKLQNLDRFPEILPQARDLLISLLTETLAEAITGPDAGILSIEQYTPESLLEFLQSDGDKTSREWEQFVA